jgi:hypothetical protein
MNATYEAHAYGERLEKAAERYKTIQKDHPRKAWGAIKEGRASIPNTAEVLAILRCAGTDYKSEAVQHGLQYLATRVFIHPRPMDENRGRWPFTRFLVYGLIGLTQWSQWRQDDTPRPETDLGRRSVTMPEAVAHCVSWLYEHREGAGWPDRADVRQCSVLQTSTAILALSRIGALPDEVRAARDLLAEVQHRRHGSWPELVAKGAYRQAGSPPHTALAVLALYSGNSDHRRCAERGRDWLLTNAGQWERATHVEQNEGAESWIHMTFALGLRACLHAGADPLSPVLRPSIDFLDQLWVDDVHEWRAGDGGRPTVFGSHAVVLAYEELKRAQRRVDPGVFFSLVRAGLAVEKQARDYYRLRFGESAITIVDSQTGDEFPAIEFGEQRWKLVRRVADLQYRRRSPKNPVPLTDLADLSKDTRTMIRRINQDVSDATGGRLHRLIHVPRRGSTCYLTVKLHDEGPNAAGRRASAS